MDTNEKSNITTSQTAPPTHPNGGTVDIYLIFSNDRASCKTLFDKISGVMDEEDAKYSGDSGESNFDFSMLAGGAYRVNDEGEYDDEEVEVRSLARSGATSRSNTRRGSH